jgi:hypothetical protein
MPWAGFEPMTPVFKIAETFHGLDRTVTVTGDGAYKVGQTSFETNF